MRIVYIEDNPANLFLVKRIAKKDNHQVIHYMEGQKALNQLEHDKPDLILMDIQLAGAISGLDAIKEIRKRGDKTPIIAVTAYAMVGDKERCLEAGCNAYIAKPIPVPTLLKLFEEYQPSNTSESDDESSANPPESSSKTSTSASPIIVKKNSQPMAE